MNTQHIPEHEIVTRWLSLADKEIKEIKSDVRAQIQSLLETLEEHIAYLQHLSEIWYALKRISDENKSVALNHVIEDKLPPIMEQQGLSGKEIENLKLKFSQAFWLTPIFMEE